MSLKFIAYSMLLVAFYIVAADELQPIRKLFHEAVLNPKSVEAFYLAMQQNTSTDPVQIAYKGVSIAMSAQNEWNPYEKYQRVLNYTQLIEQALKLSPSNIEIHFLRLCVEYHLPIFLQNKKLMSSDVNFLKKNIDKVSELNFDSSFSRYIAYFLYETNLFSEQEVAQIHTELKVQPRF